MSDYDIFRSAHSIEEENAYVEQACSMLCGDATKIAASRCAPAEYPLLFNTPQPYTGATRFKDTQDSEYRCWSVLPELRLDLKPSDMVSDQQAKERLNDPCFQCKTAARQNFQLGHMASPDMRLWIGVALAGAGVLLALVKKMR
jgi:hypothetical protein